jgi:hypothetical protein
VSAAVDVDTNQRVSPTEQTGQASELARPSACSTNGSLVRSVRREESDLVGSGVSNSEAPIRKPDHSSHGGEFGRAGPIAADLL